MKNLKGMVEGSAPGGRTQMVMGFGVDPRGVMVLVVIVLLCNMTHRFFFFFLPLWRHTSPWFPAVAFIIPSVSPHSEIA